MRRVRWRPGQRIAQRNVRLRGPAAARKRGLERILLRNPYFTRFLSCSAQAALSALIWPRFVAPYRWEFTRHDMPLSGLGGAFEGYRILQLTDLHVGLTRISYLQRVVDACLREKPDLIVITGDLIDYHPRALAPLPPLLRQIVAGAGSDGVCAIFGNHDYHEFSWRHIGARSAKRIVHRKLVEIVQQAGITLLRNERRVIQRGSSRITLVGIDEMWTGRADAPAAFADLTPAEAVICLQHNPDGIEFLRPFPWQWMLCGHTHGGQARFPLFGALYVPMERREYLRGLFEFAPLPGQTRPRIMFVSRGLGYSTPIRLFCPPEATLFTVRGVRP